VPVKERTHPLPRTVLTTQRTGLKASTAQIDETIERMARVMNDRSC
jgi:hypothetical protein